MKRFALSRLCLSLSSIMIPACGGGGPDIAKVRADLENPSGLTSDKDAVIAAHGKLTASGGATSAAGGLGPLGGLSLTSRSASDPPFSRISAFAVHDFIQRSLGACGTISSRIEAAEEDYDFSACFDRNGIRVSSDGRSASYDVRIDLGNCSSGLRGELRVKVSSSLDPDSGTHNGQFEAQYESVCSKSTGDCVDGVMVMEFESSPSAGSSFVVAWDLTHSGGPGGSIQAKGGLKASNPGASPDLEYLAYVKDSSGKEVSYVFKTNEDSAGTIQAKIRGRDGSIDCVFHSDGSGKCQGEGIDDFEWAAGYAHTIAIDGRFARYGD